MDYFDKKAERVPVVSSISSSASSSSSGTKEQKADSEEESADRSGKGEEEKAADSEEEKADRSGKGEEEKGGGRTASGQAAKGTKRLDLEAANEELRRTVARIGKRVEELEKAKSVDDQGQELLQALALSNLETARRLIEERADVNAREPTLRANI